MGAKVLYGDLSDDEVMRSGALDNDGVIHVTYEHTLGQFGGAPIDRKAIETFVTTVSGTTKPMVITGATISAAGRISTERDELIPRGPIAARIANMKIAFAAAHHEIRTCLAADMPASRAITQENIGWRPTHPGLIEDIEQGHYFDRVVFQAFGFRRPIKSTVQGGRAVAPS